MTDAFLAANKFNVSIIMRDEMKDAAKSGQVEKLVRQGAKVISIRQNSEMLVYELKNIDVVISCLSGDGISNEQMMLMDGAKKAGVKLFIPSEFGIDLDSIPESQRNPIFKAKLAARERLNKLQLPHLIVLTGLMTDFHVGTPYFGYDLPNGKITVFGVDTRLPLQYVHRRDIARYLAYLLAKPQLLPSSKHCGNQIYISSDSISHEDIKELIKRKMGGRPLELKQLSYEEALKKCQESNWSMDTFNYQVGVFAPKLLAKREPGQAPAEDAPDFHSFAPDLMTVPKFIEKELSL